MTLTIPFNDKRRCLFNLLPELLHLNVGVRGFPLSSSFLVFTYYDGVSTNQFSVINVSFRIRICGLQ
jgi:hypothetical protein